MKTALCLVAAILISTAALAAVPSSINNDDSCDVKVGPAATLLLPYFEVDVAGTSGRTTLFTITNVTRYPQIAHVTLWSDWAYPVMTFNLYLTGYDIQAINLADVLIRGTIAPPNGTSQSTTSGALSVSTNPNLRSPLDCGNNPGQVPATVMAGVREALTTGGFHPPGTVACNTMGGAHANAIGYATIDVVASCTNRMPLDPLYYSTDLLFDNVLIGDYQQIGSHPAGTSLNALDASGNPMVHIRAVPEGGGAGAEPATNLPYTFYDRYTPAANRTIDRRQPLPSTFAARFIQRGPNAFATNFTVWREGVTGSGASCVSNVWNAEMYMRDITRFDEHENPFVFGGCPLDPANCPHPANLPAASCTDSTSSPYPEMVGVDIGGWMYFNLSNGGSNAYAATNHATGTSTNRPTVFGDPRASQNWVTVTMFGNAGGSRMTAEFDAAPLGNGCTPEAAFDGFISSPPIGPAGGVFLCPPGTTLTNGTTTLCTGTNGNPAP
jgi:hypothetical protein